MWVNWPMNVQKARWWRRRQRRAPRRGGAPFRPVALLLQLLLPARKGALLAQLLQGLAHACAQGMLRTIMHHRATFLHTRSRNATCQASQLRASLPPGPGLTCSPLLKPGWPGGGGRAPAQFLPPGKKPPRPRGNMGAAPAAAAAT